MKHGAFLGFVDQVRETEIYTWKWFYNLVPGGAASEWAFVRNADFHPHPDHAESETLGVGPTEVVI